MKNIFFIMLFSLIRCSSNDEALIKYVVAGTAGNANIQYTIGDNLKELNNQTLPWEYEYKFTSDDEETYILILSAEKITGDNASIIMKIYVDRNLIDYSNFSGPYEKQTIQAKVHLKDESLD